MSNKEKHGPCQAQGRKLQAELLAELDIFQEVFTRIQAWICSKALCPLVRSLEWELLSLFGGKQDTLVLEKCAGQAPTHS